MTSPLLNGGPIGPAAAPSHCANRNKNLSRLLPSQEPFVPLNVQQQRSKPADDGASPHQPRLSPSTTRLVKRLGLKHITTDVLMIRRRRHGRGFGYFRPDGTAVTTAEKRRLAALAVPPAYEDVLYAADPNAHRPGRGWTLAISLSFAMAAGARDAQSAPTCSVGGRAAAHSTQRQPAL